MLKLLIEGIMVAVALKAKYNKENRQIRHHLQSFAELSCFIIKHHPVNTKNIPPSPERTIHNFLSLLAKL